MKRLMVVLVLALALFAAPALLACEKCIPKGSKDPNGNGPFSSAICWSADTGQWSWCVGGATNCTGDDPENVCPTGGGSQCTPENPDCTLNQNSVVLLPGSIRKCTVDVSGRCAVVGRSGTSFLH